MRDSVVLVPLDTLVPRIVPGDVLAPEPLSEDDYEAIKANLPKYPFVVLTKILRNTGLRESEVMRRTPEYFHQIGPHFFLRTARGKKSGRAVWEDVALHPALGLEVQDYIRGHRIAPGDRVFPFTPRTYQRAFKAAAQAALGRDAHPHMLRALFTKTLIDGGVPLGVAQKLLGHEHAETTMAHYYQLSIGQRAEIARRMPV